MQAQHFAIILAGVALLSQFDPPYQNLFAAVFVLGVVLYLVFAVGDSHDLRSRESH